MSYSHMSWYITRHAFAFRAQAKSTAYVRFYAYTTVLLDAVVPKPLPGFAAFHARCHVAAVTPGLLSITIDVGK